MFSAKLWMVLSFIDALSQEKGGNRLPANPGPSEVTEFSVLVQGKESGPSVVHSWVREFRFYNACWTGEWLMSPLGCIWPPFPSTMRGLVTDRSSASPLQIGP